jgi:hypothetical protein
VSISEEPSIVKEPSAEVWKGPEDPGTLIIFDWDDTLFPTTWLESARVNVAVERTPEQVEVLMKSYHATLIQLLELATRLARVAIVTLARPTWVSQCCATALPPEVQELITNRGVRVFYARNYVMPDVSERHPRSVFMPETHPACMLEILVAQKIAAMRDLLKEHSPRQVISIGDGDFECVATHDFCLDDRGDGSRPSSWLAKTVKLEPEPSVNDVEQSLGLLAENMELIVGHGDSFHMVLSHVGVSHPSMEAVIEDKDLSGVEQVYVARGGEAELYRGLEAYEG